jgi:hypothetical protein
MTLASSYNPNFVTASGGTPAAAFGVLFGGLNAGNAYFNLHTTAFPGGEIRGNLALDVPAPATLLLSLLGLAAMAMARLRSRA